MVPEMEAQSKTDIVELQQALQSAEFELKLERSQRICESVSRDEDIRKLRFQILLLEDENDELHDQLAEEEARSDRLEGTLDDALEQLKEKEVETQRVQNELRLKIRESEMMKAELAALETISTDSNKVLTEKLALARELGALRPELEHLRSQVAVQENLMSEKLSLQRQLNTIEVELENEKRAHQRAITKQGKASDRDAEHQTEIEALRKELSKAKRETEKAEIENDKIRRQLESAKKATERAQAKEEQKAAREVKDDAQLEDLRKELAKEKREREKAEKAINKAQMESEAQRSLATERAEAYKTKLRTTKEKLKEVQAELQKVQAAATARPAIAEVPKPAPTKNPRKRVIAQMDADATTLGTPGDRMPAKRSRATAMPGDKSTFSITPFLNRTTNILEDTPKAEADAEEETEKRDEDVAEAQATPTAPAKKGKKATAEQSKPLAAVDANKKSKPAPQRKKAVIPTLEQVAEEDTEASEQENSAPQAAPVPAPAPKRAGSEKPKEKAKSNSKSKQDEKENDPPAASTTLKTKSKPSSNAPRKSLASFPTFTEEPAPEKKKKRKLGTGGNQSMLGKTLFDAEDDDEKPVKPIPGKGLFAARALTKGRLGAFGAKGAAGGMMTTADGFTFSPLKKDRRAIREATMLQ